MASPSELTRLEIPEPAPPPARRWRAILAIEVGLAVAAVALDLGIPTFVLLAMAAISLVLRGEPVRSLGFRCVAIAPLAAKMLALAAAWSLVQLSVVMPVTNHLSGTKTDLSAFDDLEGNVGMLVGLLVLSWTLAALGEELAYRGYLQTRIRQLVGPGRLGIAVAVLVSSVLFGLAHSEQGAVGVVAITLDAVLFSLVRYRCRTLWASVLLHGFNNTIGFVAFFFVGPVYGFW